MTADQATQVPSLKLQLHREKGKMDKKRISIFLNDSSMYSFTNANDSLVEFFTSKMANYVQCSIPVIAFETDSFRQFMKSHRCG